MKCETCQKNISELIDNELSDNDGANIYGHLSECGTCRVFFRSCLKIKDSIQTMSYDSLHESAQEQAGWLKRYLRVPLPAAAVFIVLMIAGLFGTSLNFFQDRESVDVGHQQIIYISEHPEIEVRFLTNDEEQTIW